MKPASISSHGSLAVISLTLCYSPAISCRELQILSKAAQVSQNTYVYFKHTYLQSHSVHSPVSKDLLYFCNSITNWTVIQSHISNLTQKKIIIFEQRHSILYIISIKHSLSQFIRGWVDPLLMQSQFSMHGAIGINDWNMKMNFKTGMLV